MALTKEQHDQIKKYLITKVRQKLAEYSPETVSMPFHYRLLGKDRMALFSFIHSINTMLGQSIFEYVGKIIAEPRVKRAIAQYQDLEGFISSEAILKIEQIVRELSEGKRKPDKDKETQEILRVATKGDLGDKLRKRVDLFIETQEGLECYFELKTAKPNKGVFTSVKRELLEWIAMRGSIDPNVEIRTFVAIPYNPYEPQPYRRWTLQGLFDLERRELLVGEEFWDLLGGEKTYEDLLNVFEEVGLELCEEIDKKMRSLRGN